MYLHITPIGMTMLNRTFTPCFLFFFDLPYAIKKQQLLLDKKLKKCGLSMHVFLHES